MVIAVMRILSTNTGKTKSYEFEGATIESSMRREPTQDGLSIYFDRVDGDKFAVEKHHGIKESVVYAFSASTFPDFARLYTQDVTAGNVGENLTIDELDESKLIIGDEYEVGTARLRVSGPRYPCNRLNFCFQRKDAMNLFGSYGRPGVYFQVVREGRTVVGDVLKLVNQAGGDISVLDLFDGLNALKEYTSGRKTLSEFKPVLDRVLNSTHIPEYLRAKFQKAL